MLIIFIGAFDAARRVPSSNTDCAHTRDEQDKSTKQAPALNPALWWPSEALGEAEADLAAANRRKAGSSAAAARPCKGWRRGRQGRDARRLIRKE